MSHFDYVTSPFPLAIFHKIHALTIGCFKKFLKFEDKFLALLFLVDFYFYSTFLSGLRDYYAQAKNSLFFLFPTEERKYLCYHFCFNDEREIYKTNVYICDGRWRFPPGPRGTCLGSLAEPENNNKPVPCLLLFLKSDGKDIVFPLVLKRSQTPFSSE